MEDTYCSLCGKKLDEIDMDNGLFISKDIGYGSEYDLCHLDLHLCCTCMDRVINMCAVTPVEYIGFAR